MTHSPDGFGEHDGLAKLLVAVDPETRRQARREVHRIRAIERPDNVIRVQFGRRK